MVYHSSSWCKLVRDAGGYEPYCLMIRNAEGIRGVMPLLLIRSRLTGSRMVCLPFSDVCYPLADSNDTARMLVEKALDLSREEQTSYLEIRGAPAVPGSGTGAASPECFKDLEFSATHHFNNYIIPLSKNTEAIRKALHRGQRQQINKSYRVGVQARIGKGENDIREFYRLYLLNRRRFGIPPQPRKFFSELLDRLTENPKSLLYIAEYQARTAAAIIALRYKGVCYGKYGAAEMAFRSAFPLHALLWKLIEDAALDGEVAFDFGRTATDNEGLNAFKSRWGTWCEALPYYFHPPKEGLSVVKSDSLKYKLFTGVVRRLPLTIHERLGSRMFRHFG